MALGYKTGGRALGTPNIATQEVRGALSAIISKEIDTIPELLDKLDPKDRLDALSKLLPYLLPKADSKAIQFDGNIRIMPPWLKDDSPEITSRIVSHRAVNEDGEEVSRYWDEDGKEVRIVQ